MYKLKKIHIKSWRKLHDLKLNIGNRITLISGQNGVGKSNLLSLLSSGSGTKGIHNTYLLRSNFQPEFDQYFHIYPDELSNNYSIHLEYEYDNNENKLTFYKNLRLKNDVLSKRGIRIIPSTNNFENNYDTRAEAIKELRDIAKIGADARVPIPTIFLSISRATPLKESQAKSITKRNLPEDYLKKYRYWYNSVLNNSITTSSNEFSEIQKKLTSSKSYYLPINSTPPLSQSVGQDNLSCIISAILSFYILSKTDENYQGGILCIDEIDISLHPDAQQRLISLLDKVSSELKLQIIISSHSLVVIKEIIKLHEMSNNDYSVGYLCNITRPYFKENITYDNIKRDLFSSTSLSRPQVNIYFEDEAGLQTFNLLRNVLELLVNDGIDGFQTYNGLLSNLSQTNQVGITLGCESLLRLPDKDSYFKSVLIILDGDASCTNEEKFNWSNAQQELVSVGNTYNLSGHGTNQMKKNTLCLPTKFCPEFYLYRLVDFYLENESIFDDFWRQLDGIENLQLNTPQFVNEHIHINDALTKSNIKDKFGQVYDFVKHSNILYYHYKNPQYKDELIEFLDNLDKKLSYLLNKIRGSQYRD
ncbi:AAA family ATPase [Phascolarctobacterium faecium]|uniref:AAA family ATPase n=1 Tax=Phascolarctobacterium faecium TaxID=33025 RepID=UPI003AB59388